MYTCVYIYIYICVCVYAYMYIHICHVMNTHMSQGCLRRRRVFRTWRSWRGISSQGIR